MSLKSPKDFFSKWMFNSCCQSQFTHVNCLFLHEINLKLNLMCVRADLKHNNFPYLLFFIQTYLWTFMKSDVNNSSMAVLNLNNNTMTSKFRWSWFTANPLYVPILRMFPNIKWLYLLNFLNVRDHWSNPSVVSS